MFRCKGIIVKGYCITLDGRKLLTEFLSFIPPLGMVVFAISVFGTTLPHIFYGESLLNNKNAMQGRGSMIQLHNKSESLMGADNSTHFPFNDFSVNLCRNPEMGGSFLNRSLKGELQEE